jgi:hypothetical protein
MNDDLRLLVEWSSPWKEFVTSIRPALSRSAEPLPVEAHSGLFPGRGMLAAWGAEAVLLVAMIFLPSKFAKMQAVQPAPPPQYDVIYFSRDELPRTGDAGGAQSGRSGRSGGTEGHHATQVIRVARGASLKEQVVDAPEINLPHSDDAAVANLLAYKSVPGSPPATGLESSQRHEEMAATAVPPAAAMQTEDLHRAPSMEASAIAPSPSALQHELTSRRVSGSRMDVVPPPVSAPQEVAVLHPQLTLPQSMVVPPAPSERQVRNGNSRFGAEDPARQTVVPPAPQGASAATSRQAVGVGSADVVAPASQLSNAASARRLPGSFGDSKVIPPTAQISGSLIRHPGELSQTSFVVQPSPSAPASSLSSSHRQPGSLDNSRIIPPPAQVSGSLMRRANGLPQGSVVEPSPSASAGSLSNGHRQPGSLENSKVVPPPAQVSGSLMRQANGLSQDSSVVQPTPSASAGSLSNGHRQPGSLDNSRVVPPPAQVSGSLMRQANGLSQDSSVVQPSPSASAGSLSNSHRQPGSLDNSRIVPPPAQINGSLMRQANGLSQNSSVVQPSPSASAGSLSNSHRQPGSLDNSRVVPPPAQMDGSLMRQANGLSQESSVVQPSPSASAGSSSSGQGRRGPLDTITEAVVPPSPALASGIVLSARPGSKLASPSGSAGSLAMSPSGGAKSGLGGTGNGAGISHGNDSGSSTSGTGPGAKTEGPGHGSNETAHNGISPFPGTGGAGKSASAPPAMSGVSVSGGGSNTVRLPSFGTDGAPIADLSHSPAITSPGGPGITVVATSHSGGAFNFYGALKGDKVYTIYIDTELGTAVMQFADPKSATESYPEDLTAPQALRADLPSDLTPSRLVIACTLDRTGLLKAPHVLDGNSSELSARVLAALPAWKFRPVLRGNQPIEVNAILGFDIDTN